jgi:hypothetical protein
MRSPRPLNVALSPHSLQFRCRHERGGDLLVEGERGIRRGGGRWGMGRAGNSDPRCGRVRETSTVVQERIAGSPAPRFKSGHGLLDALFASSPYSR